MDLKEKIIQEILINFQKHEEALIATGLRPPGSFKLDPVIIERLRSEEIHVLRDKLRSIEVSLETLQGTNKGLNSVKT